MKKKFLAVALFVGCGVFVFAQTGYQAIPRLGILPFTGGLGADGHNMADLLASSLEVHRAFTVVPITDEAAAAVSEHLLQAAAFTDSDTVAGIGRAIGADYVASGHMRRLGNRNLVIATVIRVETLELVAGYYRIYRNFREIRGFLPSMTESLVAATLGRPATGRLPRLAIAPFGITGTDALTDTPGQDEFGPHTEADVHDLETLAQILAIRIAQTGEYAVLPRASVMRTALTAWEIRIADERAAALDRLLELLMGILDAPDEAVVDGEAIGAVTTMGQAADADLVLSAEMRSLDGVTMFAAQIHRTDDGELLYGISRGYGNMGEGVNLMAEIAILLTDPDDAPWRIAALNRQRRRAELFDDPARFWSLGLSAGTSFADPWVVSTLHATLAPLPFSFVRLGLDAGFVTEIEGANLFSIYPFVQYAFFLPFMRGGLYAAAGGGFLVARYTFDGLVDTRSGFFANFTAGLNIGDMLDISYTLRTDFSRLSSKVSAGFTHRFRLRGR